MKTSNRSLTKRKLSRRLEAYKHADWYGDEYEEGEYIKGFGNEDQ